MNPLKNALFIVLTIALAGNVALSASDETFQERVSLFNGKDLSGWTIENGGLFSVVDGKILVNRGTGWLRSDETYGDYILHLEFRFLEAGANSGIFVRTGPTSHDDEKGYPDNGYQIQCMDTLEGQYPIASLIPYGAPEFQTQMDTEALASAYRPAMEWQSYDVVCVGESMKIWYNGVPVMNATSIKNLSGHIGIQGEQFLLEFRTVELTHL